MTNAVGQYSPRQVSLRGSGPDSSEGGDVSLEGTKWVTLVDYWKYVDAPKNPFARSEDASSGILRKVAGGVVEERRLWAAHRDEVTLWTLRRQMQPLGTRYKPAGSWTLHETKNYGLTETTMRKGVVPTKVTDDPHPSGDGKTQPKKFRDGLYAIAYLPAAVRRGLTKDTQRATEILGGTVHWDSEGGFVEVSVLVLTEDTATVIVATKNDGDAKVGIDVRDWEVSQMRGKIKETVSAVTPGRSHKGITNR